ncbi:hypothetical protein HK105_204831 [Polyrhizophydium stewartii]|uniref:Protein kinase domain-containing protein n=1 Tax=Polyrhizophydium stewartii TaxID=2732419 RepID=A0ABR4N854_9FUNG
MGNRSSRPQRGTQPVHIHSFTPRKLLGKGNFAKVFLVERRSDQALFALKLSKKDKISAENKVHHIVEERNILEYLRHTFVTQLRYSFQDDVCLYMILDFVDGGDLRSHMKSHMWTEAEARVVIAEIACGLTYLHQNQIVHRDIKPENILMSRSGHITISDFNVAIRLAPGVPIRSMAGTEPYMAPEILNRVGYFSAVDWWSLGVLLFELVFAERPFRTKNRRELIKKGVFSFPYHMPAISEICQSAISGFLAFDPAHRIGFGEIGQPLLRGHPYFLGLSWAAVERREQAPIYVPALTPQTLHPQMAVDNDVLDEDLERLLRDTASLSSGSDPSPQQANIVEQFFYYDYMIHANRALEAQEHVVAEITASSRMVRSQTSSNDSEPPDHINSFHGTTNISFCGPVNGLSKLFKGLARRRSKNQSDFFAVDSSCITGQGSTSGVS